MPTDRNYIEEFRLKLEEAGVETSKRIELMIWLSDVMTEHYNAGADMATEIWRATAAAVYKNEKK